jgi:hypothetical protein
MVREDILGMLKVVLQKGKNLQQAVQSLYNSGYQKKEVDDAVKMLNNYEFQFPLPQSNRIQKPKPVQQPVSPAPIGQTPQVVSAYPSPAAPNFYQPKAFSATAQFYQPQQFYPAQFFQSPQVVSAYESKPKTGRMIIIVMIIMLFILLGILAVVILFKPQIENFINNL